MLDIYNIVKKCLINDKYFNTQDKKDLGGCNNKNEPIFNLSADTIFIEQRLLSAIAYTLKMKVGKLIPNIYLPHITSDHLGSEWEPKIGFNL